MTNFKNQVTRIIAQEALLELKPNNAGNNYYIELIEDGIDATLKHVKLTHMKESDTCITFDVSTEQRFKTYSPYLKSIEGCLFNKRCDFVIARKDGGLWRVYFGDLKSTRVEVGNIIKQLSSTSLFFDYVLKIVQLEFGNDELVDYIPRYICIHDNSAPSSAGIRRPTTFAANSTPYKKICPSTQKKLIVMPVGITSQGKAKVSFNQLLGV